MSDGLKDLGVQALKQGTKANFLADFLDSEHDRVLRNIYNALFENPTDVGFLEYMRSQRGKEVSDALRKLPEDIKRTLSGVLTVNAKSYLIDNSDKPTIYQTVDNEVLYHIYQSRYLTTDNNTEDEDFLNWLNTEEGNAVINYLMKAPDIIIQYLDEIKQIPLSGFSVGDAEYNENFESNQGYSTEDSGFQFEEDDPFERVDFSTRETIDAYAHGLIGTMDCFLGDMKNEALRGTAEDLAHYKDLAQTLKSRFTNLYKALEDEIHLREVLR